MSLVCYSDYADYIKQIKSFLDNNESIRDECVKLFRTSHKDGVVKLTEYLYAVNLWCPMLYKKNTLNDYIIKKEINETQ